MIRIQRHLWQAEGIGPKRADRIVAGWGEQKVARETMVFLRVNRVGTSRAVRIYKTYGADAVATLGETPIGSPATSEVSVSNPPIRLRRSLVLKKTP